MGLKTYLVRRILYMIPVLFGVSIVSFVMMHMAGDPTSLISMANPSVTPETIKILKAYYGLDKPVLVQYATWVWNLLHLNLGQSLYGGRPVNIIIGSWIWETIKLEIVALVSSLAISIVLVLYSVRKQNSKADIAVTSFAIFGMSVPVYWFGVLLILLFSFYLGWLPPGGAHGYTEPWPTPFGTNWAIDEVVHLLLPASVLALGNLALFIRLLRTNMLEVLKQDFILSARASGLSERTVMYKHALRNAVSPVLTYVGLALGLMLTYAPLTETIFSWPGLGYKFYQATTVLDFPVVMGITMIVTVMMLLANLVFDLIYALIDPRIRID